MAKSLDELRQSYGIGREASGPSDNQSLDSLRKQYGLDQSTHTVYNPVQSAIEKTPESDLTLSQKYKQTERKSFVTPGVVESFEEDKQNASPFMQKVMSVLNSAAAGVYNAGAGQLDFIGNASKYFQNNPVFNAGNQIGDKLKQVVPGLQDLSDNVDSGVADVVQTLRNSAEDRTNMALDLNLTNNEKVNENVNSMIQSSVSSRLTGIQGRGIAAGLGLNPEGLVGGLAGLSTFAADSFSNYYNNGINQGMSGDKLSSYAFWNTANQVWTEMLGSVGGQMAGIGLGLDEAAASALGNSMYKLGAKYGLSETAKKMLGRFGVFTVGVASEGIEEVIGDINAVFIPALYGDSLDWSQAAPDNLLNDFLVGAGSGLIGSTANSLVYSPVFNGIGRAVENARYSNAERAVTKEFNGYSEAEKAAFVDHVINEGLKAPENSSAYKTADRINKLRNSGVDITARQVGEVYGQNLRTFNNEVDAQWALHSIASDMYGDKGKLSFENYDTLTKNAITNDILNRPANLEEAQAAMSKYGDKTSENGLASQNKTSGQVQQTNTVENGKAPENANYGAVRSVAYSYVQNAAIREGIRNIDGAMGREVIGAMYNESTPAYQYLSDAEKIYNAAVSGKEASNLYGALTEDQIEYIKIAAQSDVKAKENAKENNKNGLPVQEGEERNAGKSSEGSKEAAGEPGKTARDVEASKVTVVGKATRENLKLNDLSDSSTAELVKFDETATKDMRMAKMFLNAMGIPDENIFFVKGQLVTSDGAVRGLHTEDGRIYIQIDDYHETAYQIARHEFCHELFQKNGWDAKEIINVLKTIKGMDEDTIQAMCDEYINGYADEGVTDEEYILQELICDMYAGINQFTYGKLDSSLAHQFYAASSASQRILSTRAGPDNAKAQTGNKKSVAINGNGTKQVMKVSGENLEVKDLTALTRDVMPKNGAKASYVLENKAAPKSAIKFVQGEAVATLMDTVKSVSEVRYETMRKNGFNEDQITATKGFMDELTKFYKDAELKFTFIGLNDVKKAKIVMNHTNDSIVISCMVKNGEYPINFDFTKICKKREDMEHFIESLAESKGRMGGHNMLEEISLTQENLWEMNRILRNNGYDTACLGCFVESRRYNIEEWANRFIKKWNNAVLSKNPDAEYFDFGDSDVEAVKKISKAELNKVFDDLERYKSVTTGNEESLSNEEKINRLVDSSERVRKLLRVSDLITSKGRTNLHQFSQEMESLILGHYGSNTPKSVEVFTPYNSEIELMGEKFGKKALDQYVKSIGGIRSQSFSDFVLAHTYDVMQKTLGMAARRLPAHTYTKVPARVRLFGMTGEKHNMSIMFTIDPNVDAAHAGLTKSGDYYFADADQVKADAAKGIETFDQSFPWKEALDIMHDPRYSADCGTIGVGYSYFANMKMLDDGNVRYIIGYHASGLPVEIKDVTHIVMAADYTNVQNTKKLVGLRKVTNDFYGAPAYATWAPDTKKKTGETIAYTSLEDDLKKYGPREAMRRLLDYAESNRMNIETASAGKNENGHGTFDLYGDLERTGDPRAPADNYIAYCIEHGNLPLFYEFAGHDNYYKFLFDFNVYDCITEEYAPQRPVSVVNEDGSLNLPDNFFEMLEGYMSGENEKNRGKAERFDETREEIYSKTRTDVTQKRMAEREAEAKRLEEEKQKAKEAKAANKRKPKAKASKAIAPTFFLKSEQLIREIKGEKIGASSIIPYLKGKGVKDEEIRWTGIQQFVEGKKSVSKNELADFIRNNDFQYTIEQRGFQGDEAKVKQLRKEVRDAKAKQRQILDNVRQYQFEDAKQWVLNHVPDWDGYHLSEISENPMKGSNPIGSFLSQMDRLTSYWLREGNDWSLSEEWKESDVRRNIEFAQHDYFDALMAERNAREEAEAESEKDNSKWSKYKLSGGSNYRELLVNRPGSTYSNPAMNVHWGSTGVLVHARIQDMKTKDKQNMLFVEEIQSDWHNQGHKEGYTDVDTEQLKRDRTKAERAIFDRTREWGQENDRDVVIAAKKIGDFFENNGRYYNPNVIIDDLENDPIRFFGREAVDMEDIEPGSLERVIGKESLELFESWKNEYESLENAAKEIRKKQNEIRRMAPEAPFTKTYTDFAMKILIREAAENGYDSIGWTASEQQLKRWNAEGATNAQLQKQGYAVTFAEGAENEVAFKKGYEKEYDQDIPGFMKKYVKQWGSQVTVSELKNGEKVWSVPITESMRNDVLTKGQPKYSKALTDLTANLSAENKEIVSKANQRVNIYNSVTFSDSRMEQILRMSTAEDIPGYAQDYVALVDPNDFLWATASSETRDIIENEAGDLDVDRLVNEDQPIYLNVDFETGKIKGHEGRHRMTALKKAGYDRVAVVLHDWYGADHNAEPKKMVKLRGQFKGTSDFYVHDILPVSNEYRDIVKRIYGADKKVGDWDRKLRYSKALDTKYLELAKDPAKNEAQLTDMVIEAGEKAGYRETMYHGTDAHFTEFKIGDVGYHVGTKAQAESRIKDTGLRSTQQNRSPHVMKLLVKLENPLMAAFDFGDWHGKNVAQMLLETEQFEYEENADEINDRLSEIARMPEGNYTDKVLREFLISLGYDGIIYDNQFEDVDDDYSLNSGESYIVFDSSQLKLADPVTYDDDGNVIPLSERFNEKNMDVRYSKALSWKEDVKQFRELLNEWDKIDKPEHSFFKITSTGSILQGLGAVENDIYIDPVKIKKIMIDHPEMDYDTLSKIPEIINNPTLVLQSKGASASNRIVMIGTVKKNGNPVISILDLHPVENGMVVDDMQKVVSSYEKNTNPYSFIHTSNILYADAKKATSLLHSMDHQSSIELLQSGFIGSITYNNDEVKTSGEKFSNVFNVTRASKAIGNPEYRRLNRKYDAAVKLAEYWKAETKTSVPHIRETDIKRFGEKILKDYSSTLKYEDIKDELTTCVNRFTLTPISDRDAVEMAYPLAKKIIESASELVNDYEYQQFKDIKKWLKGKTLYVTAAQSQDIPDFSAWKKQNRWLNVKFGQTGNVDQVYSDLRAAFPDLKYTFFPEVNSGAGDQLMQIVESMESLNAVYDNPFSREMGEAIQGLAEEIFESSFDAYVDQMLKEAPPTFADKKNAEIDKLKAQIEAERKAAAADKRQAVKDATLAGQMAQGRDDAQKISYLEGRVDSLLSQRDRRDAQIEHQRDLIGSIRRNRDAQIQEMKDSIVRQRIRRAESKQRQRLLKIARRVSNMKLPKVSRELRDQFLSELDLVAVSLTGEKARKLQHLKEVYDGKFDPNSEYYDPDYIRDTHIENNLSRLTKVHISDLTSEQIQYITEVLLYFESMERNKRKLINSKMQYDTNVAGNLIINDIRNSAGTKESSIWDKYIVSQTLSPEREVHRVTGYNDNDPLYVAMKEVSDGQREMFRYQNEAESMFDRFLEDKEFIKGFTGKDAKLITVIGHDSYGKKVEAQITPAMRASLYLHYQAEQNLRHVATGGAEVPNEQGWELYRKGKIKEAWDHSDKVIFSKTQVEAIISKMTAKEKAFADQAHYYFNEVSNKAINETSEALKGYSIANVENYFPIQSDPMFLTEDFSRMSDEGVIEAMGFTNDRVQGATNPIMLYDLNTVLTRSIAQHAKYVGLAIPVRNFNLLWNAKNGYNKESMKKEMQNKWTSRSIDYITGIMQDVQGMASKRDKAFGDLLAKVRSNYAGAVLTLNAGVAFKQTASFFTAASTLGWKPVMEAFPEFVNCIMGKSTVNTKEIAKYTPLWDHRMSGFTDQELGELTSAGKKLPAALNWIQYMDGATTRALWKAAENKVLQDNPGKYNVNSAEFKAKVAEVYNKTIEETQPNYTMMQRPAVLRSKDELVKTLNMFKTQPFQNFNVLYDAIGNYNAKKMAVANSRSDETIKALAEAKTTLGNAVSGQIASALAFTMLQYVWDLVRGKGANYSDGDDEPMEAEDFLAWLKKISTNMASSVFGIMPFVSILTETSQMIIDKMIKGFGGSPVFGGTYYGLEVSPVNAINNTAKAVGKLVENSGKLLTGNQKSTADTLKSLTNSIADVMEFFGIPAGNVQQILTMPFKWFGLDLKDFID